MTVLISILAALAALTVGLVVFVLVYLSKEDAPRNVEPRSRPLPASIRAVPEKKVCIMTCRHCNNKLKPGEHHHCSSGRFFTAPSRPTEDGSDFVLSFAVASATDSTLLGYAVGGSFSGAALGGSIHNDTPTTSNTSFGCGGSTYDSGSSSCSGDSGSSSTSSGGSD